MTASRSFQRTGPVELAHSLWPRAGSFVQTGRSFSQVVHRCDCYSSLFPASTARTFRLTPLCACQIFVSVTQFGSTFVILHGVAFCRGETAVAGPHTGHSRCQAHRPLPTVSDPFLYFFCLPVLNFFLLAGSFCQTIFCTYPCCTFTL